MKKNVISRIYSLVSATLFLSIISLQSSGQALTASVKSPVKAYAASTIRTKVPAAVNEKVLNSFQHSFAGAHNPFWEVLNDEYYAHFQSNDRQALAAFRKNGRIDYTIYYGTEKHLPAYEKNLVQSNFTGYTITATQQIMKNNVEAWLVTLENKKDIYKVKVEDDEVSILERITRMK